MSMELMVLAMKVKVGNPLRKLVLVKLADNANDNGECWPSYQHIAEQCEISRSTVKSHIRDLEAAGYLTRVYRKSGTLNQSNIFVLTLENGAANAADLAAVGVKKSPDDSGNSGGAPALPVGQQLPEVGRELPGVGQELPEGGARAAPGGGAAAAPRTSHSLEPVNEPKKINTKKIAAKLDWSSWGLPEQQVFDDWLALRKSLRATVTQTVIDAFAVEFRKAERFGFSVSDCLRCAVVAGWRGFKFEWMQNRDRPGGSQGGPVLPPGGGSGGSTRDRPLLHDLTDRSWAD